MPEDTTLAPRGGAILFPFENFHTYYVGMNRIWVHNECNLPTKRSKNFVKRVNCCSPRKIRKTQKCGITRN